MRLPSYYFCEKVAPLCFCIVEGEEWSQASGILDRCLSSCLYAAIQMYT
jgi:hypothetical protein